MDEYVKRQLSSVPGHIGFYYKNLVTGETDGSRQTELFQAASVIKLPILAAILLEEREQAELVRRALGELERPDRELFVRHYYYGQTVARAAEGHSAALLAHHGAVTWGRDVVQAWHRTQALEQYCKQRYLGLLLGRPIPVLEPEEVRELTVRRLAGEERRN